ncbi:hypothetical protein N9W32_00875 [Flavobacteriaceae bacterium]|nr:hypothetical protein [Flavobacteriaceae bacterium]
MSNKVSKTELKQHPYGFEYTPLEDGGVSVTEKERIRYTKTKSISFSGVEWDISEEGKTYDLYVEDFTQCIKDGGKFIQIDMFGNERVVSYEELKQFIYENYQY